jgi:transcriptional regulator with XRE-family HTH domain
MKLVIQKNRYTKGEIIKILREWTGKTQKEFAEDIGKSMNSIQKYEADEVNYSIQTLLDIVKKNGLVITIEKKK